MCIRDSSITGDPFNDFWYCVGVIGFSEEFIKLIPWVVFAIFSRKIKEPYDYILYACASALGFAFTENLYYLEESHNISGRSVLSTVGHMFDATLVAYGLILAKYRCHQIWKKIGVILLFFFLSCLSHGFYDYLLISPAQKGKLFITIIFFLLSLHFWMFMMNNAMNNSSFYDFKSVNIRYPKNCLLYTSDAADE